MLGRRRRGAAEVGAGPEATGATVAAGPAVPPERSDVASVTDETFLDLTEGGFTVVDFWATWCAPCRAFLPVFLDAATSHTGRVRFATCDVDASPRTAELLQIRSVPTVVVFGPDGSEVGRSAGAVSRGDLDATIRRLDERARTARDG